MAKKYDEAATKEQAAQEQPQDEAAADEAALKELEAASPEQPAEQAAAELPQQIMQSVALQGDLYHVEIPRCLLGKLTVMATSPEEALQKYKEHGGIVAHEHAATINKIDEAAVVNVIIAHGASGVPIIGLEVK